MNDLPEIINNISVPVLFADDTSIVFSHSNFRGFEENINNVLETVDSSFKRNIFSLNFFFVGGRGGNKHCTHCVTKSNTPIYMQIPICLNKILRSNY